MALPDDPTHAPGAHAIDDGTAGATTPANRLAAFQARRAELNTKVMATDHLGIKRFWNLDTRCYEDGALPAKTKELLGLVASMVLRCNDCIDYHVVKCVEAGFTDAELWDAMNVGLVVGGSIVIPHLRHGVESVELARQLGTSE